MRVIRLLAAATAVAGLVTGTATAASAATTHPAQTHAAAWVHLKSGTTVVTTAPGIAAALLKAGIAPVATWPARESVKLPKSGPQVRFSFPVTGGSVSLSPLAGKIRHSGGILFINLKSGKQVQVSRFTINLSHKDLTGIVNGNPKARVPLFRLVLTHAKLHGYSHSATARHIQLKLTGVAAKALNAALGTKLFTAGLGLGSAHTAVRF
jgi:hypothetical protein